MKGFARLPALAGAVVALGLLAGPARAEYLVQAGAAVTTRGDAPGSVAGSDVTLNATYAPSPGDPAGSGLTYSWTLDYAHGAPTSYALTTRIEGGTPGVPVPTIGGFDEPVVDFVTLGSTLYFEVAGTITPTAGVAGSTSSFVGVEVNTATGAVDILMGHGLGPVVLAGQITAVPEPATIALLTAGGGLMLLVPRLRRRSPPGALEPAAILALLPWR